MVTGVMEVYGPASVSAVVGVAVGDGKGEDGVGDKG